MKMHPSYEVFEELGHGEDTVVYRAYDISLGRDVAIKELNEGARRDPRRLEQFVTEAQFLARCQHESVLQVHAADKERGWIVMELMEGTLESKIAQGPLAEDHVRSILQQVLEALDFLHAKDKVHGKVRPSNILINSEGRVKLSDFEETELDGELRVPSGTRKYLAPELLKPDFGGFGPPLDLYCLGFTALELLAGPGFEELSSTFGSAAIDKDMAWIRWHTSEESLPPCREMLPQVPADLAQTIDCLLAKNVSDRPQTAKEAMKLLDDHPLVPIEVETELASLAAAPRRQGRHATSVREIIPPIEDPAVSQSKKRRRKEATEGTPRRRLKKISSRPVVIASLLALVALGVVAIPSDSDEQARPANVGEATTAPQRVLFAYEPDVQGVAVWEGDRRLVADEDGLHELAIGAHILTFEKEGWESHSDNFEVKLGSNKFTVPLSPLPTYAVVTVLGHDSQTETTTRLGDATVVLQNPKLEPARMTPLSELDYVGAEEGVFAVGPIEPSTYTIAAKAPGYSSVEQPIDIEPGPPLEFTLRLQKLADTEVDVNEITPSTDGEDTAVAETTGDDIDAPTGCADEQLTSKKLIFEFTVYDVLLGEWEPSVHSQSVLGFQSVQTNLNGGVYLARVLPDTPAAAAGLQAGDVVEAVDGVRILSPGDLFAQYQQARPGDSLEFAFCRDGRQQQTDVVVGSRTASVRRLPDATICVHRSDEPFSNNRRVVTNSEGNACLEMDGPGSYVIVVDKEGYAPARAEPQLTKDGPNDVTIGLMRQGQAKLSINVVALEKPLPNAGIIVRAGGGLLVAKGRSGSDGAFATDLLPRGLYQIEVNKNGYGNAGGGVILREDDVCESYTLWPLHSTREVKNVTPQDTNDSFISLFDGKTLHGWEADQGPGHWSVVDGAIVGRGSSRHLFSGLNIADFDLRADVKINHHGNGGIYLRAGKGESHPTGYEVQIAGNGTIDGSFPYTGSLWGITSANSSTIQDDTWFRLEVSARKNHISVRIDGQTVLDYVDKAKRYSRGQIALQTWNPDTTIAFRNIEIRPLKQYL